MSAHLKSAEIEASKSIGGQKTINLALQGGGSHSAFTWGVLDRLLDDGRLTFEGVSATSTGCVNSVLLADGLASGGRQAAKELLRVYWKRMSDLTSHSIVAPSLFDDEPDVWARTLTRLFVRRHDQSLYIAVSP